MLIDLSCFLKCLSIYQVYLNGYHGDTSSTFIIGETDEQAEMLVQAAKDCRDVGMSVCRDGARFSQIGEII